MPAKPHVHLLCSGLDRIRRGYESFARECFDNLRDCPEVELSLFKGDGLPGSREHVMTCLERDHWTARACSLLVQRSPYHVEQWTFARSYLAWIKDHGTPSVVFTSDANLANFLSRARSRQGAHFKILFSNGAPIQPPFLEYDHVQQVAPAYFEAALAAGEPRSKHSLVPYGIHLPADARGTDPAEQLRIRTRHQLPPGRKIVLSVGWISATHKRMDYVVREVAAMEASERPYLLLLGHQDDASPAIHDLATALLGSGNFSIRTCKSDAVSAYYQAADIFVLASLKEGFGRVYMEALRHGLPVVAHDFPVSRYVLGEYGVFADLTQTGALAAELKTLLSTKNTADAQASRLDWVRRQFGWETLAADYAAMFLRAGRE